MTRFRCSLLLVFASLLSSAGCMAESASRSIRVQAQGYVEAVPDTLTLTLSVKQTAESLAEASEKVDVMVSRVTDIARKAAVAEDDIDSTRLTAFPEYQWSKQERHYLGETVQRTVVLKIRRLDRYGELLGQLSELKLHSISRPLLSHSNIDELRLQALKRALERGRIKAEVIADEIDEDLGDVISVQEAPMNQPQPRMMMAEAAHTADSRASPVFNFAKTRIDASVTMEFSID